MHQLPETVNGTLSLLCNTKAQNKLMAEKFVQEIEEGNISGLKAHLYVKSIENLLKQLTDKEENEELSKRYKTLVGNEADTYPGKSFDLHGAKFTKAETGVKHDYTKCGDKVWDELNERMEAIKAAMKGREEFLKTIPTEGIEVLYEDEAVRVYPPVKTSTSSINVQLPKS